MASKTRTIEDDERERDMDDACFVYDEIADAMRHLLNARNKCYDTLLDVLEGEVLDKVEVAVKQLTGALYACSNLMSDIDGGEARDGE